jgi:hypothetical protein
VPNENLHTLHGRITNVHMDSKSTGGIHLWLTGDPFEYPIGKFSM